MGISLLKIGKNGASIKNCSEIRGWLKWGVFWERGVSKLFHQKRKTYFHYYWIFWLVNVHNWCSQLLFIIAILSCGLLFTREWYNIKFVFFLPLIFNYNFVKFLLPMTFISISISLKTSNFIENKSHVFERNNSTITVHDDLYYN